LARLRAVATRSWPEEVERVAAYLRESGAESRIEEFSEGTPTAEDAAKAVGCELAQIVKSLVFDCDGRSILVLVPGDRRADTAKISAAAGCSKARIAGAERAGCSAEPSRRFGLYPQYKGGRACVRRRRSG